MIIDKLNQADRYYFLNDNFRKAFEFVKNNKLKSFEIGKYEIDSEKSYVIVAEDEYCIDEIVKLEAHRKYIDIQIPLISSFGITWKALEDCKTVLEEYNSEKDAIFYSDKADFEISLRVGMFAVLMPEDAHWAMHPKEYVKKAIIKVSV